VLYYPATPPEVTGHAGELAELEGTAGAWWLEPELPAARVLVVEHDEALGAALDVALRDEGVEVARARDGLQALYDLEAEPPAVVILDHDVPQVSGRRLYTLLRRDPETRDLPVVLLSAESFREYCDTTRVVPAPESFLEKPVLPERVAGEVRRVLQQAIHPR
jgi:DNA-binding response OmpR family regulator